MLFPLQTLFNCCELIVITHSFIFESFHNHLICLSNTLSLIILNHGFIKLIFKHSYLSHLRIVFRIKINLFSFNFFLFIFQIHLVWLQFLSESYRFISLSSPQIKLCDDLLFIRLWLLFFDSTSSSWKGECFQLISKFLILIIEFSDFLLCFDVLEFAYFHISISVLFFK